MTKKKTDRKMPKYPDKPKKGRPIELTPEIQDTICRKILRGNYFETACAAAGIHKSTGYDWLRRGEKEPGSIFEAFSNAVEKAEGEAEERDVMGMEIAGHGRSAIVKDGVVIKEEIKGNWQAIAWRLERKYPKRWGRTDKLEHTGKDGGPITFAEFIMELEKDDGDGDQ